MSCGVSHRSSSDLALLWLWFKPAALSPIRLLAWKPPYTTGVALKRPKKKKIKLVVRYFLVLPSKHVGQLKPDINKDSYLIFTLLRTSLKGFIFLTIPFHPEEFWTHKVKINHEKC